MTKKTCSCCGTKSNRTVLFQGYVEDTLEYVEEWVCNGCYLSHPNDLALLIALMKVRVKEIEKDIARIKRETAQIKKSIKKMG